MDYEPASIPQPLPARNYNDACIAMNWVMHCRPTSSDILTYETNAKIVCGSLAVYKRDQAVSTSYDGRGKLYRTVVRTV